MYLTQLITQFIGLLSIVLQDFFKYFGRRAKRCIFTRVLQNKRLVLSQLDQRNTAISISLIGASAMETGQHPHRAELRQIRRRRASRRGSICPMYYSSFTSSHCLFQGLLFVRWMS